MEDNTQNNPLDPTAVTLTKAIAAQEGGGTYLSYTNPSGDEPNAEVGTAGGRYQFTAGTWKKYAGEILGDPNAPMTADNQNKIAYTKVKQWLDAGRTPAQVASMWNAGEGAPDAWKDTHQAHGNTPQYVKNVQKYAQQIEGGNEPQINTDNVSSQSNTKNSSSQDNDITQLQAEAAQSNKESQDANSISTIAGNTIQGIGDNLSFGGASQLGNELGTGFAKSYNELKGLLGGKDNSKYMPDMSFGNTVSGLGKTVAGIGLAASPELKGIFGGSEASPVVKELVESPQIKLTMQEFNALPVDEQYNTLFNAAKNADEYTQAKIGPILKQMLEDTPSLKDKILPIVGSVLKTGGKGILTLLKAAGLVELGRGGKDLKGLLGLNNLTN